MSEPNYKMMYLGTARLLCEVHARYVNVCQNNGETPSDEVADMMESFRDDFNRAETIFEIQGTGGGTHGIFTREQLERKDAHDEATDPR